MPSQAVQRISIRWLPDAAYEDTDTVALNVGGYFIDLRVVKKSGAIQWSRAGERIVLKEDPPTFRWTHIIDSLDLTIPDDAHFEKLPNGDDLEIGTYPLRGTPTDYEEVWRDITQKKSAEELSWILQSNDGSGFIGKVGSVFLAIQKSQGGFAARREDRGATGGTWKLTFEDGETAGLPTATQGSEAIETQGSSRTEGQTVEIGGTEYVFRGVSKA
ncbi:hypothetical protein CEP53_001519 [Fusarium sp. AF-6]|nr:hypothetical protein CEP53_001519 [Fusarium sp. AF-6]